MKNYTALLAQLADAGALRSLPEVEHEGKYIVKGGRRMLNLSSNDYLGLASRADLRQEFIDRLRASDTPLSASSSRLLTGNFADYTRLERLMAERFGREAALLFNSGYHANTGILPALADKQTLVLADRLVHASLIDGIRLSGAPFLRFRHNDYMHLAELLAKHATAYEQVMVVTESLFSMDGDVADLRRLVALKEAYPNVLLYVDEAHAIGARGASGLGIAEEQGCLGGIDLLVGTFGKAMASMGAYVVCSRVIREYLVNTMRPLIFSTALPPAQVAWTHFLFERLHTFAAERERLATTSLLLRNALKGHGGETSESHIIPFIVGENRACIERAEALQSGGFYSLAVRPPTVPKGTARIRFSLTADITREETEQLITLFR